MLPDRRILHHCFASSCRVAISLLHFFLPAALCCWCFMPRVTGIQFHRVFGKESLRLMRAIGHVGDAASIPLFFHCSWGLGSLYQTGTARQVLWPGVSTGFA